MYDEPAPFPEDNGPAEEGAVRMEEDHGDDEYEPSEHEVLEYCEWLGMDVVHDRCLMWISREALKAPLPENWRVCTTEEREAYYFNVRTGESIWDHPMDAYYKALYKQEKTALDKKRKKMRMYSRSLPILPLVDFFSERVVEDPLCMTKDKCWVSLPDSLCDPIDYKLFHEPVVLPTSGRTVSRHTIINNRWRDPFSREYIENRRLVPNVDKRREVDNWLDGALKEYFMLISASPLGLTRLVRLLPYLVDKDEEMCVKGQALFHTFLVKTVAGLPVLSPAMVVQTSQRPGVQTPRKTTKKPAVGGAITAVREGSGRKQKEPPVAPPPPPPTPTTFLHDITALGEEDLDTLLASLLTMSTASSIGILWVLLTKIPALGTHPAFHGFSPEVLNVLHLSLTDLQAMRAHCKTLPAPDGIGPPTVSCSNSDDLLSLQWILLLTEITPPIHLLPEVEWASAVTLFTAMMHNPTGAAQRPTAMCHIARSLKGWPEKLATVEETTLVMFLDLAFQAPSETMVVVLHDVCIHGGERLMDAVRVRRGQLLAAILDVNAQDPSLLVTLAQLGAVLVFHEVCKIDDFATTPSMALLIGQNLFPRLTRMQWRPKHFEVTVGRLIAMCTANPVLSSTVMKTSSVDFLLKELGKKKRSHDEVRVRVDCVEADMRRLEQSNAINNWLLLATGAKLRLLETTTVATTPTMVVAPRRTKPVTVERLLPTLGLQRGSVVVVTSSGAEDSDGEDVGGDTTERLRHLMEKGLQKRIDIASERAQHTTSILTMLLAMRLKVQKQPPRGLTEPTGVKPCVSTRVPRKDTGESQGVSTPTGPDVHMCALPRI